MTKLKVAILEDDPRLLKEYKRVLEQTNLVEVVAYALNTEDFYSKVEKCAPDALLLDIDISNDVSNGINVAFDIKKPTLFISGHNAKHLGDIEYLKHEMEVYVDHISKPLKSNFPDVLRRFVQIVLDEIKRDKIIITARGNNLVKVVKNDVVFLCTDTESGSGNVKVYFNNRKPVIITDFSLKKMSEKGFDECTFVKIRSSHRLNLYHFIEYTNDHTITVKAQDDNGELKLFSIPVSENYRKCIKNEIGVFIPEK